jgi:hypothetical protein
MATRDTLRAIVENGSDLTIASPIPQAVLRNLAALAKISGAKLTVTTTYPAQVLLELSREYGKSIAFVDGLVNFKKD